MFDRLGINPTQLTGLLSFAAAAASCLIAARRSAARNARVWQVLGFMNGMLFVEVLAGSRHRIHDYVNALLKAEVEYGQRREMQKPIIILLATTALICVMAFLLSRRPDGAAVRIAASLVIALLALFSIETVSLHALDAVYYRPMGPVLLIGWMWAFASIGICWAAFAVKA
jgi:hypothetical protein